MPKFSAVLPSSGAEKKVEDTPRDEQTTPNEEIRAVSDVRKQNFDSYMLMKNVLKEIQDSRFHKYTQAQQLCSRGTITNMQNMKYC